jgi:hypothetical protein
MGELEKVKFSIKRKKILVEELVKVKLEIEENLREISPAFSNNDKNSLIEEAEEEVLEQLSQEIVDAINKNISRELGV